jgi:diguanylate cyclase (GGDEF)-like protein/PAS domain S-box-containing protein
MQDYPLSWNQLLEVLPDGIAFVDEHGMIRYANEHLAVLTGYTRNELVGQVVELLVPSRERDAHVAHRNEYGQDPSGREMGRGLGLTILCHDGNELEVDVALSPLALDGREWVVVMIRDDHARRAAEQVRTEFERHALATAEALSESEQRFRLAFENNVAGMVFADVDDNILAVNDAFCQLVGRTREELLGRDSTPFTFPEDLGISEEAHRRATSGETDQVSYAKRYVHRDGRVIVAEVHRSTARDAEGRTLYFVMSERDITEERALTAQLSHQALHDPLTGLANRVLFEDRLAQAHAKVLREGRLNAVLLVDLDDFKGVNDTLGHFVGDKLLIAIARRFDQVTRSSDTLCRFGGDEFLYLAEGLTSPTQAEQVAKRLLEALAEPFSIAGMHLAQHASIGVVVCDATSTDYTESIRDADVAMYEAKREGKGHHVLFAPSMREQATSRFALLQELRLALQAGEISMHYQPIVDLATTEVVGFEAVIAASSWERAGTQVALPYVTVNLSAHQFHDPGLVSMIEQVLETSGLIPERLIIEITESVTLLDVAETLGAIEHLNRLGVGIALDDFGTGYTSLSYLALLHPKIIKIDRSFVSPPQESARNDTLLETIISLGNKLDVILVAEGIETRPQFERLRHLECALGQGYLFSPAVPANEVKAILARVPANWE